MKEYHLLSLSGGKDSTALAFFMKENMPDVFDKMELVFWDTEHELPELYDYLNKIEIFLGKPITRITPYVSFEHILQTRHYLPHPACRWCTVEMKTKPFRKFVYDKFKNQGDGVVFLYIGIRFDEAHRVKSSTSTDNYINERFPFVDNCIGSKDVLQILENVGIGLADFYKWKRRSGCYFCFYQNKMDWLLLHEHHPELFQKAIDLELNNEKIKRGGHFGWNYEMPLKEMIKPKMMKKIKTDYDRIYTKRQEKNANILSSKLINMYGDYLFDDEDEPENTCLFCHI